MTHEHAQKIDNDSSQQTEGASARQPAGNDASVNFDVAVIGAGAGGLAACIFLGKAGLRVVCVEPKPFPHAYVGESLDWSMPSLLRDLGITREQLIEERIATYKRNIEITPLDGQRWNVAPGKQLSDKPLEFEVTTLHVDRQAFDQRLFEMACEGGTTFVWDRVDDIEIDGEQITACQTSGGQRIVADWFIDASGQAALFAKAFGIPKTGYGQPKVCLWTYFKDVPHNEGTTFFFDAAADGYLRWIWDIPVTPETTSVGFIASAEWLRGQRKGGQTTHQILHDELAKYPRFEPLLTAQPDFKILACSYQSYVHRRVCGPNWLLIGEAASMPDPLTSNGVSAACRHAKESAQFIRDSLERKRFSDRQMAVYSSNVLRMGHGFNHSIEKAIYEWPVRQGISGWFALKVYAVFGYVVSALYTKFQPQSRISTGFFSMLFACVWLGMEGLSLAGKVACLLRGKGKYQRREEHYLPGSEKAG